MEIDVRRLVQDHYQHAWSTVARQCPGRQLSQRNSPFWGEIGTTGVATNAGGEMKKLNHLYTCSLLIGAYLVDILFTIIIGVYKLYFWLLDCYPSRKQKMLGIFICMLYVNLDAWKPKKGNQ